jgi:hypothetical protein
LFEPGFSFASAFRLDSISALVNLFLLPLINSSSIGIAFRPGIEITSQKVLKKRNLCELKGAAVYGGNGLEIFYPLPLTRFKKTNKKFNE